MYYWDEHILCPFYLRDATLRGRAAIVCEGIGESISTRQDFKTIDAKDRFKTLYCASEYEQCRIYQAVNKDYEERKESSGV